MQKHVPPKTNHSPITVTPLTEDQSDLANDIASQAEVFIFAHEIGHILMANPSGSCIN